MTIDEILLLESKQIVEILAKDTREDRSREEYLEEYKGERKRRPGSVGMREDKSVEIFSDTETEIDKNGEEVPKSLGNKPVFVARVKTNTPRRCCRKPCYTVFALIIRIKKSLCRKKRWVQFFSQ